MKKIEEFINSSDDSKYYNFIYDKLSETQKEELLKLVLKLDNAGAKKPLSWAFSEIEEGIPQLSRFIFLKHIFAIIDDLDGNISLADDIDEFYETDIYAVSEKIEKYLGKNEFHNFLKSYTKGVMWQVLNLIDEGNYNEDGYPMWLLKEDNSEKNIGGLHESFDEFEEELKN